MPTATESVRVESALGAVAVFLTQEGAVFAVAGRSFTLPVAQLAQWAEFGPPEPCRWGLVLDGELAEVSGSEAAARDRAAECRTLGTDARVIRLPLGRV